MIWRAVLFWLLAAPLALADLPRLSTVTNGFDALVAGIALPNYATITNQYDSLARLTNTALNNYWGHTLDGYMYGHDALGLRTNITRNLGLTTNSVNAGYDAIGQLTSWIGKESGGTSRLNEQNGYGFDAAGNLHLRTNNALVQTFNNDSLNQLSNVTRTGTLTLSGAIPAPATNVTVNGNAAQLYGDLTFAGTNLSLSNGSNTFTVIASNIYNLKATNAFTVNLPTNVSFQSDANGNLTNDGTRNFIYDAANQLTNVTIPNSMKHEFVYDGFGRKRIERDYVWQSGAWVRTNETRFIYDGFLVVQERDSNNAPRVTYTRGLDLGGKLWGADGIGGLLARTDTNGSVFYHADGGGNITALMDASQNIAGRYLYDAFGRFLGKWGTMADANRPRFSSEAYDELVEGYDYGLRWEIPNWGRFLNRDPIGEAGGNNLYRFVGNDPVNVGDGLGLQGTLSFNTGSSAAQGPVSSFAAASLQGAPGGPVLRAGSVVAGLGGGQSVFDIFSPSTMAQWHSDITAAGYGVASLVRLTPIGDSLDAAFGYDFYGRDLSPSDRKFSTQMAGIGWLSVVFPEGRAGELFGANCPLAEGAAKPFAMGLKGELDAFAASRGATTWKQFQNPENWRSGVLDKLADPNTSVHFNLNGVDVWGGIQRAASGAANAGATDWELLQIRQNPQFWDTMTFWENGQVAPNPFKP